MKATMLLAPLALAVVSGLSFATPSHACDDGYGGNVVYTSPGYDTGYTYVDYGYSPTVVVTADPYWVWVPGLGYRYWDRYDRVRYEREHRFVHLERWGQERDWRDHRREHEQFERDHARRERMEREQRMRFDRERDMRQRWLRDNDGPRHRSGPPQAQPRRNDRAPRGEQRAPQQQHGGNTHHARFSR